MNDKTIQKIKEAVGAINHYIELNEEEKLILHPMIDDSCKLAIEIVEIISNTELNYEQISSITGIHQNTCKQIIYALKNGGMNIIVEKETPRFRGAYSRTVVSKR